MVHFIYRHALDAAFPLARFVRWLFGTVLITAALYWLRSQSHRSGGVYLMFSGLDNFEPGRNGDERARRLAPTAQPLPR